MLCHREYDLRFVIDFFTRSQLLHSSELDRIAFETISKESRSLKVVKVLASLKASVSSPAVLLTLFFLYSYKLQYFYFHFLFLFIYFLVFFRGGGGLFFVVII